MTSPRRVAAVALVVLAAGVPVWAQTPAEQAPSVGVEPAQRELTGPNAGQWFVMELTQGETGRMSARLTNISKVPIKVRLYLADLEFTADGTPSVKDPPYGDVGSWGGFAKPDVVVPPESNLVAEFTVLAP